MRIIITGGSGLIGSRLTAELNKAGYEVIVLSRNPEKKASELAAGTECVGWDCKTTEGWGHLADGAFAIINLAGESIAGEGTIPSRWNDERKQRIVESRIQAGLAVVDAVQAATEKPKLVIQASAVGYYGQVQEDTVFTEESEPANDFLGKTVQLWEDSTEPVEEMGVRRVIVRTGLALSMDGGPLPLLAFQHKVFAGGRLGSGDQWMPWIHMDDEIAAIRFLLEKEDASGPYNLSAPNPVTNKEFSKVLGRVMNRPSLIPAPAFAMRAALGEISTLVLDGQRAVPHRLLEAGYKFKYPDLFYALRNLVK
ncbi:MAG: TIGR01777 family oxidoreductase [Caldilineales bacterium]|nr:TIGR01777 family oxidoreductase [Caldilineales bacterium]